MLFQGKSASLFFRNAAVLNPEGIIADSIRIERGRIVAMHAQARPNDFVIDAGGGLILPGLINAHEHLGVNNFGRLKFREVYPNAHEWSLDIEARFNSDPVITKPRAVPIAHRLFIGGIKNLLAGATTVCHHDPWHPSLSRDFPVRVARPFGYCHSLQRGGDVAKSFRKSPRGTPWIIHLAEGTDAASARELDTLDALGCLRAHTVVAHGVGLTARQRAEMIERGAALIWCPSSNLFLLHQTALVREFADAGLLALGTDSRLTGDGDLWDELRAAHATGQLSTRELFPLISTNAAKILELGNPKIELGARADLVLLPPPAHDPFDALVQTRRADLRLVMLNGIPRYGDPTLESVFAQTGIKAEHVRVDGREKLLAANIATRLRRSSIQEPGVTF